MAVLDPSLVFRVASASVLPAWLLLLVLPRWAWTHRIATFALPIFFATLYILMLATSHPPKDAGFGTLHAVMLLFTAPAAVTAGWIHYLCFDLFIGSWQVRDAQRLQVPHLLVVPCLLLTFLFGPVGLLLYLLLRAGMRRVIGAVPGEAS